ncbi:MAG: SpaA isopeptide-forming pilin-related protein [Eubacteriales bacterium]
MKQNVKHKSLRVFLALCLMVQMMGVVLAAPVDTTNFTGTITVSATGNFDIYRIFQIVELDDTLPGSDKFYNYQMIVNPDFYAFFDSRSIVDLPTSGAIATDIDKYAYASKAATWLAGEGATAADAKALALTLKTWVTGNSTTKTQANLASNTASNSLPYGYYLVVDTVVSENNYLALLTDDQDNKALPLTPKSEQLSVIKEIYHNEEGADLDSPNYGSATGAGGWGDVGDNQIGDTVYFRAEATLPTDVSGYTTNYFYTLIDFMDETLAYTDGTLEIYTDNTYSGTALTEGASGDYTNLPAMPQDANNKDAIFAVQFDKNQVQDLLDDSVTTLYLKYSATLTADAVLAEKNQQNTLHLLYSINQIDEWDGTVPTTPSDYDNDDEFDHKRDDVYDYTFQVTIYKEDELENKLNGVKFKLTDDTDAEIKVSSVTMADAGNVYVVDKNGSAEITTPKDGKVTIRGLGDYNETDKTGTIYRLRETQPVNGYSLLTDYVEFYYVATYTGDGATLNDFEAHVADDTGDYLTVSKSSSGTHNSNGIDVVSTGVADANITIINTSGTVLPETGGIGTTMFYVVGGGILALAGYLIFVQRKNDKVMKNKED